MDTANQLVVIPLDQLIAIMEAHFTRFLNERYPPYNGLSGDQKKVYSREQIAEILDCHVNTVSKYILQRKLHATKVNGIFYISETSFLTFINQTKNGKN